MSLRTVARKYALDTHRTKWAWAAMAVFVAVFGFLGWSSAISWDGRVQPLRSSGLQMAAAVLIPLVTVALGHGAVAGGRESGSLRVLLASPHSRREVVAGAFLGRFGAVLAAVVAGLLAAPLTYTLRAGQLPGTEYLVLAGFVLLWTVFCSSLALGVSALFSTGRRAIAGTLGTYLLFLFVWNWLPNQIVRRFYPSDQQYPPPEWVQVWNKLDPISGYIDATSLLFYTPDETLAVYEGMPFLAAVVAAWAVLPMGLALWRFPNVDL